MLYRLSLSVAIAVALGSLVGCGGGGGTTTTTTAADTTGLNEFALNNGESLLLKITRADGSMVVGTGEINGYARWVVLTAAAFTSDPGTITAAGTPSAALKLTRGIDAASPLLGQLYWSQAPLPTVTMVELAQNGLRGNYERYKLEMSDCRLTSFDQALVGGATDEEHLLLRMTRLTLSFRAMMSDGTLAAPVSTAWDFTPKASRAAAFGLDLGR